LASLTRHAAGNPCLIIAELGINHNGNVSMAHSMIDAAREAGVDVVKFQKRHLPSTYGKKLCDDPNSAPSALAVYLPLLKDCELPDEAYPELKAHAEEKGLGFLVSAWDDPSIDFCEKLDVEVYKVASADWNNIFLHAKLEATGKPVIMSTGMTNESEIFAMMGALRVQFKDRMVLMHAVSSYPTAYRDCALHLINRYKVNHIVPVGWSGHERGVAISMAAAACGADIIERHFTLDRTLPGPDQAASLEPEGLKKLVDRVRAFEISYGDPYSNRKTNRGEVCAQETLCKSLVAKRDIAKGKVLEWDDLCACGPGRGLPPSAAYKMFGKPAARDIQEGERLLHADVEVPVNA